MKTKILSLFAVMALSIGTASACGDSCTVKMCHNDDFKFWQGFDFGANGYLLQNNMVGNPAGYDFLELDYARSHSFAWNMGQFNVHLYKNYINLVTGIGIEWNSYALRNNVTLVAHSPNVAAVEETMSFSKNKLKSTWLNAPVLFEFNTSSNPDKSFHFAAGATFGYNIFSNRLKQEFSGNGMENDRKLKDDFNIAPFRASLTARVGYGNFSVFANYGVTQLFKSGRGPQVYPFSVGVGLSF